MDVIDRQKAIDAVADGLKYVFVEYKDIAEKLIGKLPSAESEIVRCKGCKHCLKSTDLGQKGGGMIADLISRQAAIDIVEFECGEWIGLARTIADRFKQLPSAAEKGIEDE